MSIQEAGTAYNRALNTATDRFTSLFAGNREKIFRTVTNVVLTIVVLAVFGCFDFVKMEWAWEKVLTYAYWTKVSSKAIAAVCCFNIGINFNWESALTVFYELKESIRVYESLIKDKDDEHFEYYVNQVYNMDAKKRAWINKINRQIYRLDKWSKNSDKLLYTSKIPDGVDDYETKAQDLENRKANNKYCIKRKELETLKSEAYINENLASITVKYSKVNPAAFEMDINGKVVDEDNRVTGNVGIGRTKATANVIWGVVLITSITTAIAISYDQEEFAKNIQAFWYYLMSTMVDVGLVAWNLFRGTMACKSIIEEQIHRPYVNRNKVLKGFISWKINKNIQPSQSYLHIQELTKVEEPEEEGQVIEIRKSDLEKIQGGN